MTVFKTAQMILVFCRIFGSVPYRIVGDINEWSISSKPIDYFGCITNIMGQCFLLYLSTVYYIPLSKPKSLVLSQGVMLIFRLQAINGILSTLSCMRNGRKFCEMTKNLHFIDREVSFIFLILHFGYIPN